jgi:MtN3 and saliva related transmembrane protein
MQRSVGSSNSRSTPYRALEQSFHFSPMPNRLAAVGALASLLTISAFVPQVIRSWRTRSTHDLSYGTLMLLVSQSIAWLSYGVLLRDPALIITNSVVCVFTILILVAKLRFS